jgi:two-component system nitrate/nitrite response regulator NarL
MSQPQIRIAIAGCDGLFQDALAASLASQSAFCIAGCFASVDMALRSIQVSQIDVLLLLNLTCPSAAELTTPTEVCAAGVRVVSVVPPLGSDTLSEHSADILLHTEPLSLLFKRIRETRSAPGRRRETVSCCGETNEPKLTPRQVDVLRRVCSGRSNKQAAADLGISENTIKTFVQQLFAKTGVRTRSQLVRIGMELVHYV